MQEIIELQRERDGSAFNLVFTGGLKAAMKSKNQWMVGPVRIDEKPFAAGPYTTKELQKIAKKAGVKAIAFQELGWNDGEYNSHWRPVKTGKNNHFESASNAWSNIASNMGNARSEEFFRNANNPSEDEIAHVLDAQKPDEASARYISFTLRGLDVSIEQVADYYNEQLTNDIAGGDVNGERSDSTRSNSLYAHVHSFFLHIGMARDYLAAFIACQINIDDTHANPRRKTDSMARLVDRMRRSDLRDNGLLALMFGRGDIIDDPKRANKFQTAGWVREITDLRNELVHTRPYGAKFRERWGSSRQVTDEEGFFRHFRPIERGSGGQQDILDLLHFHYSQCNELMLLAAAASGDDASMMTINSEDIISFQRS